MIRIGRVDVSLEARKLFLDGQPMRLGTRAFDILEVLIKTAGELVTKEVLLSTVWPETVVVESNLQVHISALRKLLGPDKDLIQTIPGRGYRLIQSRRIEDGMSHLGGDAAVPEPGLVPNPFPLSCGTLIGREQALEDVRHAVAASPLVTLVGTGGIGKTQLALQMARSIFSQFVDARYVDLSLVDLSASILNTIYDDLTRAVPQEESAEAWLGGSLRPHPQFVMLDNCELVIHEAAALCERLMQANPGIRILATSREPLRASFERIYRVLPLDAPRHDADHEAILRCSAVQLFIARARARAPDFLADPESVKLIGSICRRLDGLPLALELAAARVNTLGISELLAQLENRFSVLTGGFRTAPARQRSLKAAFDWSYQLLSVREQKVLQRISVFHAPFRLGAACKIAAGRDLTGDDVMEAIAGLAVKSLLMVGSCGSLMNYYLLENVWAYSVQILGESGESDMAEDQQMSLAIPDG